MEKQNKERKPVHEINKVCKAVLKLQYSDFLAMDEVIKQQEEYNSALMLATVARQRKLAEHNKKVVESLRALKEVLLSGQDI